MFEHAIEYRGKGVYSIAWDHYSNDLILISFQVYSYQEEEQYTMLTSTEAI